MKKLLLILFFAFCLLPFHLRTQWVQQTVPVSKPITGIKFIDANTGWACTSIGTSGLNYAYILHTTNSGGNWFVQDSSFNSDYNALSVVDANIVYAGGDSVGFGKLAKTTNGGLIWSYLQLPINMLIGDMQFLNKDSGWSCSGVVGPDVRTTTNGGLNWIVRTNGISPQTQKIFFLNYSTGFCGANFSLYKTTDAGLNWGLLNTFSTSVQSIFFLNSDTAWVGLSPSTSARVAYTSNGGLNWTIQNLEPYNFNISSIFFFNNTVGFAGVAFNKIYKSTNSGQLWGYQDNPSGSNRITFLDTSTGWSGWNGISKTTNGGGQINYVGIININTNLPNSFKLYQNYPNPFNSQTNIRFSLTKRSYVQFKIYDVTGKEKSVWQSDKELEAGTHELQFDANELASGVYFYSIIVSDGTGSIRFKETRKMVLVK